MAAQSKHRQRRAAVQDGSFILKPGCLPRSPSEHAPFIPLGNTNTHTHKRRLRTSHFAPLSWSPVPRLRRIHTLRARIRQQLLNPWPRPTPPPALLLPVGCVATGFGGRGLLESSHCCTLCTLLPPTRAIFAYQGLPASAVEEARACVGHKKRGVGGGDNCHLKGNCSTW